MDELKKLFNSARGYKGHSLSEAAKELGVSTTFLNQFFSGDGTSAPLEKKVRRYITNSGMIHSIVRMELHPDIAEAKG